MQNTTLVTTLDPEMVKIAQSLSADKKAELARWIEDQISQIYEAKLVDALKEEFAQGRVGMALEVLNLMNKR